MIYEQFLRLMLFATVYNENPRNTEADRKCFCGNYERKALLSRQKKKKNRP